MPWPRGFHRRQLLDHRVLVLHEQGQRRSQGHSALEATQTLDPVTLNLHASPTPIALLASREICVNCIQVKAHPRGQPFNDHAQGRPMGFAGGSKGEAGQTW